MRDIKTGDFQVPKFNKINPILKCIIMVCIALYVYLSLFKQIYIRKNAR